MLHIFNLFLVKEISPDELKIAQITPIFKGGDDKEKSNCRPISVLSIMDCRHLNHLTKNKILYSKQFWISKRTFCRTCHNAINQSNKQNFENNEYTLGVFVDFSKAFDTADHQNLIKKSLNIIEQMIITFTGLKVTLKIRSNT